MKRAIVGVVSLSIALAVVLGLSGNAFGVEKFFKGKTIRFIVGASPGGGYDTYTRAAARHISKHFPGNPTPVVQNLTGAGGLIVANYLYNKVKPDGLTVGVWNNVFLLHQAMGSRRVNFKGRKYGWVGAPVTGWPSCAVMGFTGLKSWDDLLKAEKPLKVGSSGGTGTTLPTILNIASGKKLFDIVPGYKGTAIVRLALQARELGGVCMAFESMRVTARSMLDAGRRTARENNPAHPRALAHCGIQEARRAGFLSFATRRGSPEKTSWNAAAFATTPGWRSSDSAGRRRLHRSGEQASR